MLRIFLSIFLLTSILTACSIFSPIKTETSTQYVINMKPAYIPQGKTSSLNLLINKPRMSTIYNTTQIAYSEKPYQISYFVKNRWAETPGEMLYPLIIQTLEATHSFHFVGSSVSLTQYDYIVNTNIIELQQDYAHKPHTVSFKMRVEIINAKTNNLVASEEFSAIQNISQDNPYSGAVATNQAVASLLTQLTDFILKTLIL